MMRGRNQSTFIEGLLPNLLIFFGLFLYCIFIIRTAIQNLDIKVAWGGFSPIGWVYKTFNPMNFMKDFPGGMELFDKTAFMYVYKWSFSYLGIPPEHLLPIVIGIEIVAVAIFFVFLGKTILPQSDGIVFFFIGALAISGFARSIDLAYFGSPFFAGIYYNAAEVLRILAIIMMAKGKLWTSVLLLILTTIIHPTMGLMGTVFVFAMLLTKYRQLLQPKVITAGLTYVVIVGGWVWLFMGASATSSTGIPTQDWINLTKLNSFHWYPIEYGTFTYGYGEKFLPFLSFLLLLVYYMSNCNWENETNKQMAYGMAAMLVLVLLGVFFSTLSSPTLIKLALHRASGLVIDIGLIYVLNGLWQEIKYAALWRRMVALYVLISPLVMNPGYPVIFSLLLISPTFLSLVNRGKIKLQDLLLVTFALSVGGLLAFYQIAGLDQSWMSSAYTGFVQADSAIRHFFNIKWFLLIGAFFSIFAVANVWGLRIKTIVLVAIFSGAALYWTIYLSPYILAKNEQALYGSYKQAQIWAKQNTPPDSLFMVDPTIYYGWRDYSQRSSFGNVREWLYNWAYADDVEIYKEGRKRMNEFPIKLNEYIVQKRPLREGFPKLNSDVRHFYNSASDEWRAGLVQGYDIDYFVFIKDYLTVTPNLPVVFENQHFVIYKAKE